MDLRELAVYIAEKLLFQPYHWGGDNPLPGEGFDCSGFVIEVLKSVGKLPREGDWTASMLATMFPRSDEPAIGNLVFFAKGGSITHVEMIYYAKDGVVLTIGASGGGSKTDTVQEAIDADAYVKIRLRSSWTLMADPFSS